MNGLKRKQPRPIALVVLLQNISVSHSSFDFRVFVHGSVLLICYHHLSGKQGKSHTSVPDWGWRTVSSSVVPGG